MLEDLMKFLREYKPTPVDSFEELKELDYLFIDLFEAKRNRAKKNIRKKTYDSKDEALADCKKNIRSASGLFPCVPIIQ